MIFCNTLNKDFASKEDMFRALKSNNDLIIKAKKSTILKSAHCGGFQVFSTIKDNEAVKGLKLDDNYIYPVINTTKYMDSHDDVHFDNIWNKTIKDNQGKIMYIFDHDLSVKNVIAWGEDVEVMVKSLPWSSLGADFDGETQALIYKIAKDKIASPEALNIIEGKRKVQNSVRMQYVKIKLAVNSNDKDFQENKALFDSRIEQIANKDKVKEQGYFYAVDEAKIVAEGSMVLRGSNDITPILQSENDKPEKSALNIDEPEESTQKNNNLLNLLM